MHPETSAIDDYIVANQGRCTDEVIRDGFFALLYVSCGGVLHHEGVAREGGG